MVRFAAVGPLRSNNHVERERLVVVGSHRNPVRADNARDVRSRCTSAWVILSQALDWTRRIVGEPRGRGLNLVRGNVFQVPAP